MSTDNIIDLVVPDDSKEAWNRLYSNACPVPPVAGNGAYRFSFFLSTFSMISKLRTKPDEVYAARIARAMRIRLESGTLPYCMAVSFTPSEGHVLHVSLDWFRGSPVWEAILVLQHEIRHVVMLDNSRLLKALRNVPESERTLYSSMVANPAADCAVNSQLCVNNPDMRTKMLNAPPILATDYDLPEGESSEFYVEHLDALYTEACCRSKALLTRIGDILDRYNKEMGAPAPKGSPSPKPRDEGAGEEEGGEEEGGADSVIESILREAEDAHKAIDEDPALTRGAKRMMHQGLDHALRRAHIDPAAGQSAEEAAIAASMSDAATRALEMSVLSKLEADHVSIGSLPNHLASRLAELRATKVIPWEKILAQHVQARIRVRTRSSMRRPSRSRFGTRDPRSVPAVSTLLPSFPGRQKDRTHSVLFCVDTSGSMSNSEVMAGMCEVYSMLKAMPGVKLYVAQMDTVISALDEVADADDFKRYLRKTGRTSCGGTSCQDLVDLVNASWTGKGFPRMRDELMRVAVEMPKIDACIYFTDGGVYAPRLSSGGSAFIWCVTHNGAHMGEEFKGVRLRMDDPKLRPKSGV